MKQNRPESSDREFGNLVDLAHEAAVEPRLWLVALEQVRRMFHADFNVLFAQDLTAQNLSVDAQLGFDPAFRRSYETYFIAKNAYIQHGQGTMRPGHVCRSEAACPDSVLDRSEYYNDWLRPQGMGSGVVGTLVRTPTRVSLMTFTRRAGLPSFSRDEIRFVARLMPHWQQAIRLHYRLGELRMLETAVHDAFDSWSVGVVLLDDRGAVVAMNRTGRELTGGATALFAGAAPSTLSVAGRTSRLRRLIASATLSRIALDADAPGGTQHIVLEGGRRLCASVVPLPKASLFADTVRRARVAVFLTDVDAERRTVEAEAATRFKLTPAEIRLALRLAEGLDLATAAERLGITRNTAKTQSRAIYGKTGVRRQTQLIWLFAEMQRSASVGTSFDQPKPRTPL